MIYGNDWFWPNIKSFHRSFRKATTKTNEIPNFSYKDYTSSYDLMLDDIVNVRKISFETDYRRRSSNFDVYINESPEVNAYIEKEKIYLSRGLLIAIEDASQSICSDSRSHFTQNIEEKLYSNGKPPWVSWNPEFSKLLDPHRFVDYSIHEKICKIQQKFHAGLLHKFVSFSKHRQDIADLIATMSIFWVTAHEDAHNYLGHCDYFENAKMFSSPDTSNSYFNEFFTDYKNKEEYDIRLSAEIMADKQASWVVVDHFAHTEAYKAYPFLNEWIAISISEIEASNTEISKEKRTHIIRILKTIFLFRLCSIAQVICVTIFQRRTIKKNFNNLYHPNLGTRILNIIESTIERLNSIAQDHNFRNLSLLEDIHLKSAFQLVEEDTNIILKYLLEIGFVLKDPDIKFKKIEDSLDININQKNISDLSDYLQVIVRIPYIYEYCTLAIDQLKEKGENISDAKFTAIIVASIKEISNNNSFSNSEVLGYLEKYNHLTKIGNKHFFESRKQKQKDIGFKVKESYENFAKFNNSIDKFFYIISHIRE